MTYAELKNAETTALVAKVAELKKEAEAKRVVCDEKYEQWKAKLSYKVETLLKGTEVEYGIRVNDDNVEIQVYTERGLGKTYRNSSTIDISIRAAYDEDYKRIPHKWNVEMNWASIGAVKAEDKWHLNYAKMIGAVAGGIGDLSYFVNGNDELELLKKAQFELYTINHEIRAIEGELKNREGANKAEEVRKSLKVGNTYRTRRGECEVTKIGKKCVFLNYGSWKDERVEIDTFVKGVVEGSYLAK